MQLIKLQNISKVYGSGESSVKALNGVNLTIDKGEMLSIMGKSGSGKSTMLNILGGLDKMDGGSYYFGNKMLNFKNSNKLAKFRRDHIGFIVQHFALIDECTVFENVALPLKYKLCSRKEISKRVKDILEKLEIDDKIEKYPNELSGGQCQRVAIARAVINKPDLILADEPTGALDELTEEKILSILKDLNREGKTIVIVTHDTQVSNLCDRIIYIKDGALEGDSQTFW